VAISVLDPVISKYSNILSLCRNLAASPSGYYDWQKRRATPGLRAVENQTLA
jgi:putative transposase